MHFVLITGSPERNKRRDPKFKNKIQTHSKHNIIVNKVCLFVYFLRQIYIMEMELQKKYKNSNFFLKTNLKHLPFFRLNSKGDFCFKDCVQARNPQNNYDVTQLTL